MGKQRRKFETGFKQQIVSEVESGLLALRLGVFITPIAACSMPAVSMWRCLNKPT